MNTKTTSAASTIIKTRAAKVRAPKVAPVAAATPVVETPAPVAAPAAPAPIKPMGIRFAIATAARPGSGAALYAHTHVFLTHSGITSGTPIPTAFAREVIGDQAVAYHTRQGNFETIGDKRDAEGKLVQRGGMVLTAKGATLFATRKQNNELVSAFENVLCRGEYDDRAGFKNPALMSQVAGK